MIPWSRGYDQYKERAIQCALQPGGFDLDRLSPGYGLSVDERIIEIPWLFSRLTSGKSRFLDAGSALNHRPYLTHPLLKGKNIQIFTLAPESECFWHLGVSYSFGDLRHLPFRDGWFDEIACISTLEHVGMDNTRLYTPNPAYRENAPDQARKALGELARVLRPGGTFWCTVPVGKPANHGWLQVFHPEELANFGSAFAPTLPRLWYFRYTPQGWQVSDASAVKEATYFDCHQAGGPAADLAAAARAVGCLEITKPFA